MIQRTANRQMLITDSSRFIRPGTDITNSRNSFYKALAKRQPCNPDRLKLSPPFVNTATFGHLAPTRRGGGYPTSCMWSNLIVFVSEFYIPKPPACPAETSLKADLSGGLLLCHRPLTSNNRLNCLFAKNPVNSRNTYALLCILLVLEISVLLHIFNRGGRGNMV
jgi:hypothetical protein